MPWPPGTAERRWPAGGALPTVCGPDCLTDSSHHSCTGSGCKIVINKGEMQIGFFFFVYCVYTGFPNKPRVARGVGALWVANAVHLLQLGEVLSWVQEKAGIKHAWMDG